jgi:hypothetical protein
VVKKHQAINGVVRGHEGTKTVHVISSSSPRPETPGRKLHPARVLTSSSPVMSTRRRLRPRPLPAISSSLSPEPNDDNQRPNDHKKRRASKADIPVLCGIAALSDDDFRFMIAKHTWLHLRQARPNLLSWLWQEGVTSTNKLYKGTIFGSCAIIRPIPHRHIVGKEPVGKLCKSSSPGNANYATTATRYRT